MNKPEWTPELGLLLESLRIKAGIDLATMARRNMVSTLQVKQLEKGGGSGFYNEAIKFTTGQKLLKFFDHTLKLEAAPAPAQVNLPSSLPLPEVPINAPPTEPIEQIDQQPQAATFSFKPYVLGLAFIVIVLFAFSYFQMNGSDYPSLKVSENLERKVAPSDAEKMSPQQVDVATAPQPAPEKSSMSAAVTSEKIVEPQFLNATCQWAEQEIELKASSPQKRGEYVHVVALENATVCIKDGAQRVASLSLASGQARSIYGSPPFSVYSSNFSIVKLYYQGKYIKLPSEDIRQIKLSPTAPP